MEKVELLQDIRGHLEAIFHNMGVEVTESNQETATRVAKMWVNEVFKNMNNANIDELTSKMTTFKNEGFDNLIVIKDIEFNSFCEHHLLPFSGKVKIGYIPSKTILGLSKFPRAVEYFSKKPQLQERLTREICDYLSSILNPVALFVQVVATHTCVACRGAESLCSTDTVHKFYASDHYFNAKNLGDIYNEFLSR